MLDGSGRCFRSVFVLYKSGSCLKSEYCCYESSLFHYGSLPKITFFKTAVLLKIRIRIPNTGMDLDFEGRQIRIKIRNIGFWHKKCQSDTNNQCCGSEFRPLRISLSNHILEREGTEYLVWKIGTLLEHSQSL